MDNLADKTFDDMVAWARGYLLIQIGCGKFHDAVWLVCESILAWRKAQDEKRGNVAKLVNQVVVEEPETCRQCPFHSYDGNWGSTCNGTGELLESWRNGKWVGVTTPEEALANELDCMFIQEDKDAV